MRCPFCNLNERVLKENQRAMLFLSNPRKTAGHFLVSPKRHVEKPWDLSREELLDIFDLVAFAQQRLVEKLSEGCDVRQHYRPFIKQGPTKVDHVHYHIIPRDLHDKIYKEVEKHETALFEKLTDDEHDKITEIVMNGDYNGS